MSELGTTSRRVLSAIVDYKRRHDGCAPTVRELRKVCRISSNSVVHHHLNRLEEAGFIRRLPGRAGAICVVGGEWRMPEKRKMPAASSSQELTEGNLKEVRTL